MIGYCGTRLSPRKIETANGKKIYLGQTLTHSGWATYRESEIFPDSKSDDMVDVYKSPEEVSRPTFLASLEGADVTVEHPRAASVNKHNWRDLASGHVQNIRTEERGDGDVDVLGDLHLPDSSALDQVEYGIRRDLSVGFTFELAPGPREDTYSQVNMRANHVALVSAGRMPLATIGDTKDGTMADAERNQKLDRILAALEKLLCSKEPEPAAEDARDPDLIPAIATTPKAGTPADRFGAKLTPPPRSDQGNKNPVTSDRMTNEQFISEVMLGGSGAAEDSRVLDSLRELRPFIVGMGDAQSVSAYNTCVLAAKRRLAAAGVKPISAFDGGDSRATSGEFERNCTEVREQLLRGEKPSISQRRCREARDQHAEVDDSYEAVVRRRRDELLAGKK